MQSSGIQYFFGSGFSDEAIDLVVKHHYSHRAPANVQFVGTLHEDGGLFGDRGTCIAAAFFSLPPTRWSEKVWELSRLVKRDDINFPLTSLISKCVKYIKKSGKIDLLVSFADSTQGHHGGIYQAASWLYGGKRERRIDGILVNGHFYPGRTCNSLWGTRSPQKLKEIHKSKTIEPHYDEGKHLYYLPLDRRGKAKAKRLGLEVLPYPKPSTDS